MAKKPVGKKAVAKTRQAEVAKAARKPAARRSPAKEPVAVVAAAIEDGSRDDAGQEALWAQAEIDYADPTQKITCIAKRVGLSRIQLGNKAKYLGWPMRTEAVAGDDTAQKKAKSKSAPKPIELLRHVCSTIEGELTKLDRQNGDTSQDRERASRALSQMVNSLEKTIGMQSEVTKDTAKGSSKTQKEELAHADELRRQIAERIERLHQKRTSADGSAGGQ